MTGKELLDLLDKSIVRGKPTLVVNSENSPDLWNKIKDFISEFYFLKAKKKLALGYPVDPCELPEHCKVVGIYHKKTTETIRVRVEVDPEDVYGGTWCYDARIKKSELLDDNFSETYLKEIVEKRLKYLNRKIEKAMITIGKAAEEIEKIEKVF